MSLIYEMPLGRKILMVRMLQRWGQQELAKEIGVAHTTLSYWESGEVTPTHPAAIAAALEDATGVPKAWWLGIDSANDPFDGLTCTELIDLVLPRPKRKRAPAVGLEPTTCRLTTSGLKAAA